MQANPSFALDCCTTCPGTVAAAPVTTGTLQVFHGSGAPTGLQAEQNPLLAAIYYNDDNGVWYPWDVAAQEWVLPPEIP